MSHVVRRRLQEASSHRIHQQGVKNNAPSVVALFEQGEATVKLVVRLDVVGIFVWKGEPAINRDLSSLRQHE